MKKEHGNIVGEAFLPTGGQVSPDPILNNKELQDAILLTHTMIQETEQKTEPNKLLSQHLKTLLAEQDLRSRSSHFIDL